MQEGEAPLSWLAPIATLMRVLQEEALESSENVSAALWHLSHLPAMSITLPISEHVFYALLLQYVKDPGALEPVFGKTAVELAVSLREQKENFSPEQKQMLCCNIVFEFSTKDRTTCACAGAALGLHDVLLEVLPAVRRLTSLHDDTLTVFEISALARIESWFARLAKSDHKFALSFEQVRDKVIAKESSSKIMNALAGDDKLLRSAMGKTLSKHWQDTHQAS